MDFPFDILDHIFSFLISHPECLIACSEASPVFSHMVEKYRYYHVVIHTGETKIEYCLEPSYLTNLLSDKPRIANYVHVLQVEFPLHRWQMAPYLEQIIPILPMFPVLECIVLSAPYFEISWEENLSQDFKKAIEGCLHLPSLKEVHVGCFDFPLSTLDDHANIDCFSFSGTPTISEFADATYPHLTYLSVEDPFFDKSGYPIIFNSWAKQHIAKLQSLKCDYPSDETTLELLASCSDTLNNLDLSLTGSISSECESSLVAYHSDIESFIPVATTYELKKRYLSPDRGTHPRVNLSSLSHLQHLTIRAVIYFSRGDYYNICVTFLPAAMEILNTVSSLQQLTIEINVNISSGYRSPYDFATIDDVDLSPLTGLTPLAENPVSIRHIDLYFNFEDEKFPQTKIVSLLAMYGGLKGLIKRGVLVVHMGTAQTFLDKGASKCVLHMHQRPRSLLDTFT